MSATERDSWWECPKCGGQTETDAGGDGPDRFCPDCGWSYRIPRVDELDGSDREVGR
jgi:rubredoxin